MAIVAGILLPQHKLAFFTMSEAYDEVEIDHDAPSYSFHVSRLEQLSVQASLQAVPKFNGISPPWDTVDQALRYVAFTLKLEDVLLGKIVLVLDKSKTINNYSLIDDALSDVGDVNIYDPHNMFKFLLFLLNILNKI